MNGYAFFDLKEGETMEIKDLIGARVVHKLFGEGIIENAHDRYLEVAFLEKNKKSRFSYPSCFNGFLELKTEEKIREVEIELEAWRIESGEENREELKRQYWKTQMGILARRDEAEERKLKAAQRSMMRNPYHQFREFPKGRQ